ncbi:type I polyketide synthase [Actinospica robiniae]|uniref:type I polyketide synthase n=1 Tax=Actinospica robiniae TaxID=304901 RepID=UPI000687C601|nr:type I polyketide synthase [Actinospica robiniae]
MPIAIVGRGCVLPGAESPSALWDLVASGGCALTHLADGRWRMPLDAVVPRHAPHDIGGYVASPGDAEQWTLEAATQALDEAGPDRPEPGRSGLALGWLTLPGEAGVPGASPASNCAQALGFGAGSIALDAACASSLYALKIACDRLHDGAADLMLAGGVSAADPLLIQAGFTALSALSPTGRSRPLHRDADGLVPAEGAALVALMRLADAQARGIPVLGIVRGVGLSNDGRSEGGLLVPSEAGQKRAMYAAYAAAGVAPESVTLLECHATGTARGDAAEVRSSAYVFSEASDLVIGAVKANIGHAMTAAGAVGILKVLGAIEHGIRPAMAGRQDERINDLQGSRLRSPERNEPWNGVRRAAVSAFGFGGNNAHVIIDAPELAPIPAPRRRCEPREVAVVAKQTASGLGEPATFELEGLRIPPSDLKAALARHVLIFETARAAAQGIDLLAERTQVLVTTGCDPAIRRYTEGLRRPDATVMTSAQVVGFLTNMTANRISSQLGLSGASFATDADVLALAARAISTGEADAALVGSVDDAAAVLVLKRLDHARRDGDPILAVLHEPSIWHVFSGEDRAGVLAALDNGQESRGGPARLVIVAADGQLPERARQARRWLLGQAPKPRWAAYRDEPLPGRIAAVYPGGAAAYVGMGAQLGLVFPEHVADLVRRCPQIVDVAGWVNEGGQRPSDTISCVWGAAYFAHLHTAITRDVLGIGFEAALGYSSGESTALTALGAWQDLDGLVRDLRASPLFTRDLAGSYDAVPGRAWKTYLVTLPAEALTEAARGEAGVYLMAVNSPGSCTFGGDPSACERVSARLGAGHVFPLDYDLAIHAPVVEAVRDQWYRLHLRPTTPVPGISFYGCAAASMYELDDAGAATANTAQAVGTLDFRGTVENAWADGVRIFIEHGPSGGCTEWIAQTLGDREFLAVSLDGPGTSDIDNLGNAVAALIAAGVDVDDARLETRLREARTQKAIEPVRGLNPLHEHHELVTGRHRDFIRLLIERHAGFLAQREKISALLSPTVLFDRADLEYLAVGAVSKLFGPTFAAQDGYARQTRMPAPPMLLADRVLRIDAVPASIGAGTIQTQTDVRADSWYLDPCGRMPAGLLVEAGQADLLLISWLGADLLNRGERVYRLLGCEITYHASPPHPGETLTFDISIDDHAEHGGVRLFLFHYDCHVDGDPRLSVRNGQAGFFTDAELRETRGVVWDRPALPEPTALRRFDREQIRAFAEGRLGDEVGAHVRTPRPAGPEFLLFDEVEAFDVDGAYVRATLAIRPDSWFFEGHFVGDPCMPGTLMLDGAFQLMAFHLSASGCTAGRDGWRFEPVPEHTCRISCRAQVIPESKTLTYELFVKGFEQGEQNYPTLVADVLCSVDGVKAFLAEGLAVRLVPDWPLDQWRWLGGLADHVEPKPAVFGLESLLACAWGRPSEMMGSVLAPMDDGRRVARLPGPPYHFMSRIVELGAGTLVAEYDVPAAAWFWDEGGGTTMPLCVLLEVALQPCGWLALYTGDIPNAPSELLFRNLGGQGTFGDVRRDTRVLRTEIRLLEISKTGAMIIDAFDVRVWADERLVADLRSDFGFFPPAAFADQPGLPGPIWGDTQAPAIAVRENLGPMLSLIDRITGYWPNERRIRAEKDIAPEDWYFRSHFFQDPVQPGSLGIEAMLQLLQCFMMHSGLAAPDAVFEPSLAPQTVTWKYRGQVVPHDRVTVIEVEVTQARPGYAVADAWLSVGGRTIYHATGLGLRADASGAFDELLDPAIEPWVADHRPTWTLPALPMMSVVDRLAAAAGHSIAGLRDIRLTRWIMLDKPVQLRGRASAGIVELEHDGEVVASAVIADVVQPPDRPARLADPVPTELPYPRGAVFHGSAFHYLTALTVGSNGASGTLDAARGSVPRGRLHQGLLDATLHAIPHDELWRWSDRIRPGHVGYPYRLPRMDFFGDLPSTGELRVEARFAGFDADLEILPTFDVQVFDGERLLLAYRLVEVLVPLGPLAGLGSRERAAFLRDREYVPGAGLSTCEDGVTRLRLEDVEALEWFPGTVAALYNLPSGTDRLAEVAVRDHIARLAEVHPSGLLVTMTVDLATVTAVGRPGEVYRVVLVRTEGAIEVREAVTSAASSR